jgi:transposase
MERETIKLVNVLRRIARAAGYAAWVKSDAEAARFCLSQYNKVLARISELEPAIKALFTPLRDNSSPEVVRIAARELAAYFEDDAPDSHIFKFAIGCGPRRVRARSRCFPVTVRCE